eukprot:6923925-Pyramimonas_sp.AAC.1
MALALRGPLASGAIDEPSERPAPGQPQKERGRGHLRSEEPAPYSRAPGHLRHAEESGVQAGG